MFLIVPCVQYYFCDVYFKNFVGPSLIDMTYFLDEDFREVNMQAGVIEEINMTY